MAIKFTCPNCQKQLSVKDQLAGKKGNCPFCKKPLTVPKAADAAAPTAPPAVPPRQVPLTQPAPRGHVPADTAPAPSPEPTPAGAAWLSTILAGILFLLGAALALYTLARPFLPAH